MRLKSESFSKSQQTTTSSDTINLHTSSTRRSSSSARMAEKTGMDAPGEQRFGQRKVSYTDILNRMRTSTFARRRTAPDLFTSNLASSSSEPQQEQPQALPRQSIPSRASRGSSFFSELNTFIPRSTTSQNKKEVNTPEPKSVRQPRKITNRYFQQHSCFNSGSSEQDANEILIPKPQPKTQITQRALMQPISNPPLPRRSTMGNLTQNLPGQIPNFMRPTSSSAARRNTARVVSTTHAPTKTVTPNKARARLSGQTFRPRNFSLPSSSRLSKGQVPESATPATPPKLPVEPIQESTTPPTPPNPSFAASKPSNQSERPILTMNSNLTFEEMLRSVTPDEELNQVSEETAAIEETSDEPAAEESGSTQEYLQVRLHVAQFPFLSISTLFANTSPAYSLPRHN